MKNIGLLIVDAQVGFNPSQKLLSAIQEKTKSYTHVAMTRFTNTPDSLYRTALNWHGDGGALALLVPNALVLEKTG